MKLLRDFYFVHRSDTMRMKEEDLFCLNFGLKINKLELLRNGVKGLPRRASKSKHHKAKFEMCSFVLIDSNIH